jgi:L-seryl-tRNA(Ser) seleniumtransferase
LAEAEKAESRRNLPSVDRIVRHPALRDITARYRHHAVVTVTRSELARVRQEVARGEPAPAVEEIAASIRDRILGEWSTLPIPVINASGVILHTNLGRAPLSREALRAVEIGAAYSDLEIDMPGGGRDNRQRRVRSMLTALTGAEAAHVTGNNAGAMLLSLSVLAAGREVIVSRGQAVEIGGSFRIPDILGQSGCRLVEVGTTNRTRLSDYQSAIGPNTAAILHVHSSNFRLVGFTESVSLASLSQLRRNNGILLLDDNGSGALLDTAAYGLEHEPTPQESLAAGSDIVTLSGDKLLGGPQAGIILGRAPLIDRIAESPLARALRPDKLTLSGLAATLTAYLVGDAESTVPIWQMIGQSAETIRARAGRWRERAASRSLAVELVEGESTVGGGSVPGSALPTTHIVLPAGLTASSLRAGRPAVLPITRGGRALLDLRTVAVEDEDALLQAVLAASA